MCSKTLENVFWGTWKHWLSYCVTFLVSIHAFPILFFRKIEQWMNGKVSADLLSGLFYIRLFPNNPDNFLAIFFQSTVFYIRVFPTKTNFWGIFSVIFFYIRLFPTNNNPDTIFRRFFSKQFFHIRVFPTKKKI